MTLDVAHNVNVLFGGYGSSGANLGDTWTWSGSTWTQVFSSSSPSARRGAVMAYDPALGETVLYGGYDGTSVLSDTWAFNGSSWTELSPSTSPGPLAFASLSYDQGIGKLVLFGGATSTGNSPGFGGGSSPPAESSQTWIFDGTTWAQLSPATSPPARDDASMAYDASASNLVLYGGYSPTGTFLGDTWIFDGATWTEQSPYDSPPALASASNAMAYDAALSRVVMFGGTNASNLTTNGFYLWNGASGTWEIIENSLTAADRSGGAIAPAGTNGQVVLFAGYSSDFQGVYSDTQILDWGIRGASTGDASIAVAIDDTTSATVDLGTGNLHVEEAGLSYAGTAINLSTGFS